MRTDKESGLSRKGNSDPSGLRRKDGRVAGQDEGLIRRATTGSSPCSSGEPTRHLRGDP